MEPLRPYPPPTEAAQPLVPSMPAPGVAMPFSFTTMEGLIAHFSQWIPAERVHGVIETEKEIFVVRREVSLHETRLQFLKKCEGALTRAVIEFQSARAPGDWTYGAHPQA